MFRQLFKVLEPLKNSVARTVRGTGSAFERNCVSKEQQITEALKKALPGITYVSVEDISGGCGAMFEVSVEAKEFIGLSIIKQHRLIADTLKSEIAEMHGIRINTNPSQINDK